MNLESDILVLGLPFHIFGILYERIENNPTIPDVIVFALFVAYGSWHMNISSIQILVALWTKQCFKLNFNLNVIETYEISG